MGKRPRAGAIATAGYPSRPLPHDSDKPESERPFNQSVNGSFRPIADMSTVWMRRSEASGRDYVDLSLAAPEFGPRRGYANLGSAAGGDNDSFALIWSLAD